MRKNTARDFWSKVDIRSEDECWLYTAKSGSPKGYGIVRLFDRDINAHVAAFILTNGEVPSGLQVMHTCHNKRCCNPKHLKLGTNAQNSQDTDRAILNWDKVRQIRKRYLNGESQYSLGKEYNTDQTNISRIVLYKNWKEDNAN